jgi:hypothetical protein
MLVGYMRVSTDTDRQVLDLQRDALLAAGVDERHLFEDRAREPRRSRWPGPRPCFHSTWGLFGGVEAGPAWTIASASPDNCD